MTRTAPSLPLAALLLLAATSPALAADGGPTTLEHLIRRLPDDGGMIGTVAVLLGVLATVWCLLLLLIRRHAGRLPFVLLALLALVGIAGGGFATWQGLATGDELLAQLGPAVLPRDQAAAQASALGPVYFAVIAGGASLLLALAGFVRGGGRPAPQRADS